MTARRGTLAIAALACLAVASTAQATFPGRNGPILFRSDAGNTAGHDSHAIWRLDGRDAVRVTRGAAPPGFETDYSPVVLPDGRRFVYIRQVADESFDVQNQIYVKPLSAPAAVLGTPVLPESVDYKLLSVGVSPDGERLVLAAKPPPLEAAEIFLVELGGAATTQLTHRGSPASAPEFSPDGRSIVFADRGHRTPGIFTVDVGGGGLERLTTARDGAPSYSPSGRRIVFNRTGRRGIHLFSMRPDGSRVKQLTHGPFVDRGPVFSPDGRLIAFSRSGRGRNPDLYTMRPGGAGLRLLFASRGRLFSDFGPDWGPDRR